MGQYIIPGVGREEVSSAIGWVKEQGAWTESQVWDWGVPGGVLFTDPSRDDAACAALYTGFTGSAEYEAPLPDAVLTHLQHLRDYRDADATTITNAQTVHVVKDLIRAVFLLNRRYETEG